MAGINFDRIDSQQRNLMEITQGIAGIHMQHSRTVTTVSSGFADVNAHIDDLRAEIQRTSSTVTNPILRSGLEIGMNNACEGLKRHLGTRSSMKSHWPAQQTVASEDNFSIAEEYDDDSEESVPVILGNQARTTPAIKRPNQKRSRSQYEVDTYNSFAKNMLGEIYFTTKTFRVRSQMYTNLDASPSDDQYEFETTVTLHPAPWLIRWGVNFGLRVAVAKSTEGWKQKLETYCAVPDDSLIFEHCSEGNLDGVRLLLSSGMASPRDTNSNGWTPLDVRYSSPPLILI